MGRGQALSYEGYIAYEGPRVAGFSPEQLGAQEGYKALAQRDMPWLQQAGDIAGYADYLQPLRALKDEIITRAEEQLAAFAPRASMGMINALDEDGSLPGANIRMEAAKQILDRVGLSKREKLDITAKVQHGVFISPPKDNE